MSDPHRHITPRVIAYLRDHLSLVDAKHRVRFEHAQNVLRACTRWARHHPDEPGTFVINDSIAQLAEEVGCAPWKVRLALDNLERIGLVITISHGGGRGQLSRGSVRHLILDPVDNPRTARGYPAQFRPILRGVGADTARGKRETARGQPRDTVMSSVKHPSRRAPVDDGPSLGADVEPFYISPEIYERIGHRLGPHVRPKSRDG